MSNNFNQKEYNSVVLGGLLHDIGKFMNRAKDIHKKHPYCSEQFVSDDTEKFKKLCKEEWIHFELLKTLCKRHHENLQLGKDYLVQEISDEKIRALAYIVSRADNYSSAERERNESYDGEAKNIANYKNNRLASIFSEINISGKKENRAAVKNNLKYLKLKKLSPENAFAVNLDKAEATRYEELYNEFGAELKKLEGIDKFSLFYNALYSIFENTLTGVPCDASLTEGDVSLFDHLSTTSAIAACLYQYHSAAADFSEKSVTDDGTQKFRLFYGDLSGIQKFIFNIKSRNPKKLAKTLRGRSYFLGLLSDAASIYILKELNLPIACRILNAGGNFTLLIPATDECAKKIEEIKLKISKYMLDMFAGELSFFTACSDAFAGKKFTGKGDEFKNVYESLKEKINIEKNSAYKEVLWSEKNIFGERYDLYAKNGGECSLCGVHPKKHKIADNSGEEEMRCEICHIAGKIGEAIISKNAVAFCGENHPLKGAEADLTLLGMNVYFARTNFLDKLDANEFKNIIFIYHLNSLKPDEIKNHGYYIKHVSTYIPHLTEKTAGEICDDARCESACGALCDYCSENNNGCEAGKNERPAYNKNASGSVRPLYFQCLSVYDKKRLINQCNIDGEERGGIEAAAILKADVDRLGAIFGGGFETYTISRVAALSRSLNYFFTGVLPDMIKNECPFIYTVYAGGDDLFLIGPWLTTIEFAVKLREKFKLYVCGNEDISISTAVHLMKPNDAIAVQAEIAEEMLDKAKHAGRDKITLFGTPIKWEKEINPPGETDGKAASEYIDVKTVIEFGDYLNRELRHKESKVTMAFLYRLLKYHKMYLSAKNEGKVESLIFHSKMNYDIQRNIIEIKDGEQTQKNKELTDRLEPLYKLSKFKKEGGEALMKKLNIALSLAIYANRKS